MRNETFLDEFGEVIAWRDDADSVPAPKLREDPDPYGFRERLTTRNTKYDARITEAVRAEDFRILDEALAEQADTL